MARAPAALEIEELPEADRLDGFAHPRATIGLFGHATAEATLADAFRSGRMHHAWIVAGPEGIGKATLAYRFARFALAAPGERDLLGGTLGIGDETTAARQVRALSHPNLLVLRRAYDSKAKRFPATIPIDEVRRLKGFLALKAAPDAWRVVIVDRADELNLNAANALLKSLEEPPERTIFLLVSAQPGRLLMTIRSRCRTLELSPLASEPLRQAATQALVSSGEEVAAGPPTPSEWEPLANLAGGSVRRLLLLHASGGLELYERVAGLLDALPDVSWGKVHTLADELAGAAAEQRYELFFDLLLERIAALVRISVAGEGEQLGLARRLIPEGRLATWAGLWERVAADKADTAALNLDRKALILDVFQRLAAAARR